MRNAPAVLYNNRSMEPHGNADKAVLALSDGGVFYGRSCGAPGEAVGEVIFNTAMSGYQEILTDPSYDGQIINFTHPHIGNTGINAIDEEGVAPRARAMVARRICEHYSSWRATRALPDFLRAAGVVAIDGVDTRAITRRLRSTGALGGCVVVFGGDEQAAESAAADALAKAKEFDAGGGLSGALLADAAGRCLPPAWTEGAWRLEEDAYLPAPAPTRHVVVLDCGAKKNILRELVARGCRVSLLPYGSDAAAVAATRPDGVLFSNGPGDPAACAAARELARALIAVRMPLFGLCLGHQIIASALGAETEKMKFGHHGANHPVADGDKRVLITSQNHGFAVRAETLPPGCRVTHVSLFDGSLQGFCCDSPPLLTFQGHPEASPGPRDAGRLFDDFIRLVDAHAETKRH